MRKLNRRSKDSSKSPVVISGAGSCDVTEQHAEKRIRDLESENDALKREIVELRCKLGSISSGSSIGTRQSNEDIYNKSSAMKEQAMSSKSKPDTHSQCSTKNTPSSSASKQSNDEVHKLKAQKVKLQCKIKLDSMNFRLCRASLEKEILQLKKEQRKNEFEKHVLLALNRRQKMILQMKHTQAFTAVKQLKLLLQSKNKINGPPKGTNAGIQEFKSELQLMTRINSVHSAYERQMKEIAEEIKKFGLEAEMSKAELLEDPNPSPRENQVVHSPIDSELKELKEEFNKLSTMFSQMEMTKSQPFELEKSQGMSVDTSGNTNYHTSTESSPSENSLPSPREPSHEMLCTTKQSKAEVCCSCTKRSLCKTPKCQCKANGSGCGPSCGCMANKCTNRGVMPSSENGKENAAHLGGATRSDPKLPESNGDKELQSTQTLRDIGNTLAKAGRFKKAQKQVAQK